MTPEQIVIKLLAYKSNVDEDDISSLLRCAERLLEKKWHVDDVIAYLKLTEEFNSELTEDYALAQMSKIYKKYQS
jgi:uncharacterized membrane protein